MWVIIASVVALLIIGLIIWVVVLITKLTNKTNLMGSAPEKAIETMFNTEFREELRNRGRLHFEKIITDSAMFLQQDLRLTSTQLADHIKNVITTKLQDEINNYEQTVRDAKDIAIEAIKKTNQAIEEERKALNQQIQTEVATQKKQALDRFASDMADIINHYLLEALGKELEPGTEVNLVIAELQKNKQAIIEDLKNVD